MGWGLPTEIEAGLYAGNFVAAAILTLALSRLSGRLWIGMLTGVLVPPLTTLAVFLYLEAQQPVGPFFAVVGVIYLAPSLLLTLCGAVLAAFLLSARD